MKSSGDHLFKFDWSSMLRNWSKEQIAKFSEAQRAVFPKEVFESQWLGFDGATNEEILATEERLGIRLPPSYRNFLKVSNGWRLISTGAWSALLPVDKIGWFRDVDSKHMNICIEFAIQQRELREIRDPGGEFEEDEDSDMPMIPPEDFRAALQINDGHETTILLNPNHRTPKGEWELLEISADFGLRHKSFKSFMRKNYHYLL